MRTLPLLFLGLTSAAALFSQNSAPIPPDPLELATGSAQVPATPEERATIVSLLLNASTHYQLHARISPPHILQISFNAAASTLYPGGAGNFRETWISGQNWRWDGNLGSYSLLRISSNTAVYDQNPNSMLPLRMKMLASAVFAPMQGAPRRENLRMASVSWKGTQITCVLSSFGQSPAQTNQPSAEGRRWDETEYCIDPATGLLTLYSLAPGIYTVYDYANALKFHGLTLPGRITVTENGTAVLDAQLTSIADTDPKSTSPFTPTAQMIAQAPAIALGGIQRFSIPLSGRAPGAAVQPTVVHVVIDPSGTVQEVEALQTSADSAAALSQVTGMKFVQMPQASGASPIEREAFITVRALFAQRPALN